jgi:probable phosphoglycerate mutase
MQSRAVSAIRHWNDVLGPEALYIAVSHGDVIKSIIADAMGTHLDHFQRIMIDPGSVSAIRYSSMRPFVLTTNSDASRIERFISASLENSSDAPVGGGTS